MFFALLPIALAEHVVVQGIHACSLRDKSICILASVSRFCNTVALSRVVWEAILQELQKQWPSCMSVPEIVATRNTQGPKAAYRIAIQDTMTSERLTSITWFHYWSNEIREDTGLEVGEVQAGARHPLRFNLSYEHRTFKFDSLIGNATFFSNGTMDIGMLDFVCLGKCEWKFVRRVDSNGFYTPTGRVIQFVDIASGRPRMAFPALRVYRVSRGWVLRSHYETFSSFTPENSDLLSSKRPMVLTELRSNSWRSDLDWLVGEGQAFHIDVMNWGDGFTPRLRFGNVDASEAEGAEDHESDDPLLRRVGTYLDWSRQF